MRSVFLHIIPLPLAITIGLAAVCSGCSTTSDVGTRSTAPVTVAEAWRAALVDNDPERALALVADDFSAPAWADRAVLSEYLRDAAARGYFSGVVVLPREIESSAAGDSVRLYPVGLRARMGTAVFELVARQDDGEWKIISANLELY